MSEALPTQGCRVLPQNSEFFLDDKVYFGLSTCVYFRVAPHPNPPGLKLVICSAGCRVDCLSGSHLEGGGVSSSEGYCTVGQIHSCSRSVFLGGEGPRGTAVFGLSLSPSG